jgi:hypothetical protein
LGNRGDGAVTVVISEVDVRCEGWRETCEDRVGRSTLESLAPTGFLAGDDRRSGRGLSGIRGVRGDGWVVVVVGGSSGIVVGGGTSVERAL